MSEQLNECKRALVAAINAWDEPEAAAKRLHAEYEGVMPLEDMVKGAVYAAAVRDRRMENIEKEIADADRKLAELVAMREVWLRGKPEVASGD